MNDRDRGGAFVPHDLKAPIRGAAAGPLAGLTAAVKDMYDIAGERTGAGSPDWLAHQSPATETASAVARILAAGAEVIGKTVCDEFFFSLAGINAHYGMPANPRAPGRLPGGSSSGSAAATAAGLCDFALGSDTGGSIRVPASFCGLFGLRPTHGRVDLSGAMAMAPSFDTAGWFARSATVLRTVGAVLLDPPAQRAAITRLLVATDGFAQADGDVAAHLRGFLDRASQRLPKGEDVIVSPSGFDRWREAFRMVQGYELWSIYGDWMTAKKPSLGPGVRERVAFAATVTAGDAEANRAVVAEARTRLRAMLPPGTVMALPTAPSIAPLADASAEALDRFRARAMALTCMAGLSGVPQVTLPVGTVTECPVGLSFIGWAAGDEALLDLAVSLALLCDAA